MFNIFIILPISANSKEIKSILLFGDSIIAGYGLKAKDSIPVKLENKLKQKYPDIKVINGGISGDTTSGGLARIEWTIKKA